MANLVEIRPDARIHEFVNSWPVRFTIERALKLGFSADKNVETIIRDYASEQGIKL